MGDEHCEVEEMGKGWSVQGWERACCLGEEGTCAGMGGEETLVESEMCTCGGEGRECSETAREMGESGSSTVGGTCDGAVFGGRLVVDSAKLAVVA